MRRAFRLLRRRLRRVAERIDQVGSNQCPARGGVLGGVAAGNGQRDRAVAGVIDVACRRESLHHLGDRGCGDAQPGGDGGGEHVSAARAEFVRAVKPLHDEMRKRFGNEVFALLAK